VRDVIRIAHSCNTTPRTIIAFQNPGEAFSAGLAKRGGILFYRDRSNKFEDATVSGLGLIHFNHDTLDGSVYWPRLRTTDWSPNYGDMLVCAAIIRQISGSPSFRCNFGELVNPDVRQCIVRGSTYLHNEFDFQAAIRTLESCRGDIVVVGLGAQNAHADPKFLDDNTHVRTFLKVIEERSKSISVRGRFSAEVVSRLGYKKEIRVTGCPSLAYYRQPVKVNLDGLSNPAMTRMGVSIHSGLQDDLFCRNGAGVRHLHVEALRFAFNNASRVSIFEQGNVNEFDISDRQSTAAQRLAAARKLIETIGGSNVLNPEQVVANFVSVESLEDWLGKARDNDLFIGFRFHGNMVGLFHGIPCFYFTYDSRLEEFCDIYKLPFQRVDDSWISPVARVQNHDWDAANAAMLHCYEELKRFWTENGVAHRLS
jgi:Polysaccharide pyruvyl transferase